MLSGCGLTGLSCVFGGFLKEELHDRLVYGVCLEGIKRKLLTEENLSFERVVQITINMKVAEG